MPGEVYLLPINSLEWHVKLLSRNTESQLNNSCEYFHEQATFTPVQGRAFVHLPAELRGPSPAVNPISVTGW